MLAREVYTLYIISGLCLFFMHAESVEVCVCVYIAMGVAESVEVCVYIAIGVC